MKLVVVQGPELGSSIPLTDGKLIAGRDEACAIRLPSARVSRRHAAFFVRGRRCVVQDMGSANGVYVNGHKMDLCELLDGTYVQLGDVLLMLAVPPEQPVPEPLRAMFVESDSGIDPDDPDVLPTMLAPASPELRALRAGTMPSLFNAAGAKAIAPEDEVAAETTAPAVDEKVIEGLLSEEPSSASLPAPTAESLAPSAPPVTLPVAPPAEAPQDTVAALRQSLGLNLARIEPSPAPKKFAEPSRVEPPPPARVSTQRVEASLRNKVASTAPKAPPAPDRGPWVFFGIVVMLLLLGALCGAMLGMWLVKSGRLQVSSVQGGTSPDTVTAYTQDASLEPLL